MALSLASASLGFAPTMGVRAPVMPSSSIVMETKADLVTLAEKLNPSVGYWDPIMLGDSCPLYGKSQEEAIGWLRHAEIKHGRVAMAAFVGYIVQSNGIHFPWATTLSGTTYAEIAAAGSPPAQWDALPTNAKWQIFFFIGLLELWGECGTATHYTKGGKPGEYPSFKPIKDEIGHPVLDLFDPFGFSKNASPEKKEKGLLMEINNGRLAQIGIMGFVSEAKVPGSVPGLSGLGIKPYDGECMSPWAASDLDHGIPFLKEMLDLSPF